MSVVDEEGRLFGLVNVVDALVVLFVVALAVAGLALVLEGAGETGESRYVTIDFGPEPAYVAERMSVGDTARPSEAGNMTVTDIYVSPGEDGPRVVARASLEGRMTPEGFRYGGEPLRFGRALLFQAETYTANGTISGVDGSAALRTGQTTVVLGGEVPGAVAERLEPGYEVVVGNHTAAVVEELAVYNGSRSSEQMYLSARLETRRTDEGVRFGATPVVPGRQVVLPIEGYQFTGTIERVGDSLNASSERVVVAGTVSAETAQAIEAGDAYHIAGRPVATVESVTAYGTENPDEKRVFVGLSLDTVQVDGRQVFGPDREVREGMRVPFRTNEYEFAGEIVRVGASEQRGAATTRTITLELENVRPDRADDIESGMTETVGDRVLARLTDVQTEPATLIVESDDGQVFERDHPVNEDVTITAELTVRETSTGLRFKGRSIQLGDRITLVLGSTTVRATVTSLDG